MSDPSLYTYPSPLQGMENLPPLPTDRNADGKSFRNPPSEKKSEAYERFVDPITNGVRGGFDVHIYFFQQNERQLTYARELWERIRREFPELRIYQVWEKPLGPHPVGMFEVNLHTPAQFGAFIPWLAIYRGPLSALIHPNTMDPETDEYLDEVRDHTQRAIWMGEKYPLEIGLLKQVTEQRKKVNEEVVTAAS